jgi:hypothetical protein
MELVCFCINVSSLPAPWYESEYYPGTKRSDVVIP